MNGSLAALEDAVASLRSAWVGDAARSDGGDLPRVADLGRERLMDVVDRVAAVGRHLDAIRVEVSAEVARESRAELGADSLAKQQGYRNPVALIAATAGTSMGDAARLIRVGEATAPRAAFGGEPAPARHPHVAAAMGRGEITAQAAAAIISLVDRLPVRDDRARLADAERALCAQAVGLTLDQLAKVLRRAEAHLDPAGVEPREHELRARRSLRMFERDGLLHLSAVLDPESAAPVKTVIAALVSADFRCGSGDGVAENGQGETGRVGSGNEHVAAGAVAVRADVAPETSPADRAEPDVTHRTVPQRQADALALLAAHFLGCDGTDQPIAGATVVVRVNESDLHEGSGHGVIDGIAEPVSIAAVRRMAAGGEVIAWVLGGESRILDWSREKRLFTKAQRLALVERDGGCAMCGCDPGLTRVHHVRWWHRDQGPTDIDNGVLLCDSCHHRIHEDGWEIRIEGVGVRALVWFIPPPQVDPTRRPRLGGRARYDYLAG